MLTLTYLKPLRTALTLKRPQLALITGIDETRLRDLELRNAEPWFDEAVRLHRALGTRGINRLMNLLDNPTLSDIETPLPVDEDMWRNGARASLSLAVRMCVRYGLSDPADLAVSPLMQQVWAVVAASERHPEAPGWCPWCAADILGGDDHLPTCLGNNLLTTHSRATGSVDPVLTRPAARVGRPAAIPAYGLKALRLGQELTQRDVAEAVGIHSNYYAQLERGTHPLSVELAGKLALYYNVDRSVVYARPDEG